MGADRRQRRRRSAPQTDLSHTHLRAMFLLLRQGEATAGALARAADLNPASVTAMVDQLQRRGLVRRRRHDDDRRVCLVALTVPGRDVVAEEERRWAERFALQLDGISDAELRSAAVVLDRLRSLMDDAGGGCRPGGEQW
jgi:DNA-binding MarR family transcriptional regulator